MSRVPLLQRLPLYALTLPVWGAAVGFTFLTWHAASRVTIDLPAAPGLPNGYRFVAGVGPQHLTFLLLGVTSVVTLAGSVLVQWAALPALALLLLGCSATTLALHSSLIFMYFLPVDIALYVVAARRSRRTSTAAAVMTAGVLACYTVLRLLPGSATGWLGPRLSMADPPGSYLSVEFAVILPCVIFWLAGSAARQSREHAESLAAQRATAERLRISRELHDSVAHNIGIIAVLAGAAGRVMHSQPQAAREAMSSIETTSRDTLTGLQTMLRALRHAESGPGGPGGPSGPDGSAGVAATAGAGPLDPLPGLRDLDRLTALASGAGVQVEIAWRGERRALPPEIDLSAFRIIQEAVTNVVRHSGAASCQVELGFEAGEVSIEVVDAGPGPGTGHSGYADHSGHGDRHADYGGSPGGLGLLGMRERVTMLSGQFSAGPLPAGGFRVAARIPA